MAIDATVPVYPPFILAYGNLVTVQPADSIHRIEVWRAPDNGSGAPNDGAAVVCTVLPPSPLGGVTFADPLPNDNAPRYYKSRHFDEVGNFSAFTSYSDGLIPSLLTNTAGVNPVAAFGAIVDSLTNTKYEMRFAASYTDPDTIDGMQSYIDFPAGTNFMRMGRTPVAIASSTNATPIKITTSSNHGLVSGDTIVIRGHTVNTHANGLWIVTFVDATNFTLNGSVGNGVGGATGHVVKLSMTVDKNGALTVYGAINANTLFSGPANFSGLLTSTAGALFRGWQHSMTGNYLDTTVNRLIALNNTLSLFGDAGTGTNNESVRLGDHSVITAGSPVARTTANQTTKSGWTDPDGLDDGQNVLILAMNDSQTFAAASRLWNNVGDPTAGTNIPAYDTHYTLGFHVSANATSDPANPFSFEDVTATVTIEYSTNGGSTWNPVGSSYSVNAHDTSGSGTSTTQLFQPTLAIAGVTTALRIRLILSGVSSGTGTVATCACDAINTGWNNTGGPYPVTWSSTSGVSKNRRGFKAFDTTDGTDHMPHGYLAPLASATPDANCAEGEIEFVGSTQHTLAFRDDEKVRYVDRVLAVETNLTTTNAGETEITSPGVKLAAGRLNAVGRTVNIRASGTIGANTGTVNMKININDAAGGTLISSLSLASSDKWLMDVNLVVQATGTSGTVRLSGWAIHGTTIALVTGSITVNTTVDQFIVITGLTAGAVTLTLDAIVGRHSVV